MNYQLDFPELSCLECAEQVKAGERGPETHRPFPCAQCPNVRFQPLDHVSDLTLEANYLLASLSTGMGTPPFEFVLRVLNVKIPSPLAREVTERLALLWKIHRERHEAQQKDAARNGHGQPADGVR